MNKTGTTFWITGLSGAGKTTVGKMLYEHIRKNKSNIVLLDGDILRQVYQDNTYSKEGRVELTYRNGRLCKMLNDQGIDVIICCVAMFDECRAWNRDNIINYIEIYLKVSIEELIKRDQKQLYSRALRNEIDNVMGINMDYEEPQMPNIVIENYGDNNPEDTLRIIINEFNL